MLNLFGLGVTLVMSQLATTVIVMVGLMKLVSSKWFVKKYFEWFKETMKVIEEAVENSEDEES